LTINEEDKRECKMKEIKYKMKEIKYELGTTGDWVCGLTRCEHSSDMNEDIIMVGSGYCHECKYNKGADDINQIVFCSYPEDSKLKKVKV
jgi:hypothetical protein